MAVVDERRISAQGYYNNDGSLRSMSIFVSRETAVGSYSEWRYFQRLDSVTFRSAQKISMFGGVEYKVESQSCFDEFFGIAKLYEIPLYMEHGERTFCWGKVFSGDKLVHKVTGGE